MTLQGRFHRNISETACIAVGSHVLVALSGGADSVALLSLLLGSASTLDLQIEAAHLDHALRAESAQDAAFVARFCAERRVPLTMRRLDVAAVSKQRGGNLEETARELRREFLAEAACERGCDLVALGHHADDQAETFMMRLLRGAGQEGLAGMRLVDGPIVRPLLPFSRAEILEYLASQDLSWCEDASNRDQGFTRNRIRHQLMPLLASFNPQIVSQLNGLCERLRQDEGGWEDLVQAELVSCVERLEEELRIDRERLIRLSPALAGRLVRAVLREVRGDLRGISARHVAAVLTLASAGPVQGETALPGAWVARRYGVLLFRKSRPQPEEVLAFTLSRPGDYPLPDGRVIRVTREERALGEATDAVEFCADSVTLPLEVRGVRPGDRMRPSGMSGRKKVQDLFVDLKLTREARRAALVFACGEELLWIAGVRRCEGYWPGADAPVLRVRIITNPST